MNKVLYSTTFLQLKETDAKNGKKWYYAHRPNTKNVVVIVPYTDDEILFLIEERPALYAEGKGKYSIGLPAGLVGDERLNESEEDAIHAELLEEAGLVTDKVTIFANKVAGSSGSVSETCIIAAAYIKNKNPIQTPVDDGGIIIDRVWVKKKNVLNWINQKNNEGFVISAQTLAGLFYLFEGEKI